MSNPAAALPTTPDILNEDTPLPSYLARHMNLGFNSDDVTALINSIDSSQSTQSPGFAQLPAELLLEVLEYVPVDHILEWRLVCRGFRDAIDGRVLYHHLHRTELIGYLGPRHVQPMHILTAEQYEKWHLMRARFSHVEDESAERADLPRSKSVWSGTYAVFQVEDNWSQDWQNSNKILSGDDNTPEVAALRWSAIQRLELRRASEGFESLRWCIRLGHAVLDLAFPLEAERDQFLFGVNLARGKIRVAWRDMLFGFLKTEASLRRLMEKKQESMFTYSHTEDCLRAIRRQRLQASLNVEEKVDRHIKWSLRLLPPLFGKPRDNHTVPLEDIENEATALLLLLRREAAMTPQQIASLQQLAVDYETMKEEISELDTAFREFKSHLSLSGLTWSASLPMLSVEQHPRNPIAWPDQVLKDIEDLVRKWKSQKKVVSQMKMLLNSSNLAMTLPEDSFDNISSDF
ncbi:hypothetical protein T440DRAFT_62974 [Plenodomus tracheiphilus IPT5]|uniref:F-box domain-containing protein n=1 Tax=Plenodomus tracheiphilus IPT5 TaxID=1408161 RepID=A0A6A7B7W5_9PLEO|nr:hypothetical protein T440DRAFT_62974 [Plenodomus tracheiphilus IPT5]